LGLCALPGAAPGSRPRTPSEINMKRREFVRLLGGAATAELGGKR
jgi:hypothetical protein